MKIEEKNRIAFYPHVIKTNEKMSKRSQIREFLILIKNDVSVS